jgi:serine/threonine-protein kinase
MIGCSGLFGIEILLGLPVLTLAPVLAVFGGMVFVIKGGILSGAFYIPAGAMFVTAVVMALWPRFGLTVYGIVTAACFFVPGLIYYRRHRRAVRAEARLEINSEKAG